MKALKLITLERVADASAIVCNIALGSAALAWAVLVTIEVFARIADIGAYQQIAYDCVRSL
ncbi:hypothetical protein QMO14_32045 [Variovorax sp. CAN2819]|uniref:hypothetical protein n=1 Tax=Variovorax sp. CAN15 TaxID=3046727 RepID=UPI00264A2286|nr:hypothetical protein [Variovorax sp. CAN15]MDN6888214.1 hypothetical protein [Variovorax sp. CAN15]